MFGGARRRGESGETLVEVVVTLVILSIAAVAILTGVETSVRASDITRKEANSGAYVHSYAELIEKYVGAGNYAPCATYSPSTVGFAVPTGYTAVSASPKMLSGSGWAACSGSPTITQLTLTVKSNDTVLGKGVTETLAVVLRKPCANAPSPGPAC